MAAQGQSLLCFLNYLIGLVVSVGGFNKMLSRRVFIVFLSSLCIVGGIWIWMMFDNQNNNEPNVINILPPAKQMMTKVENGLILNSPVAENPSDKKIVQSPSTDQLQSESYSSKIVSAYNFGTPHDAMMAAATIIRCAEVDENANLLYKLNAQNSLKISNDAYLGLVRYIQAEQRRCQTISASETALKSRLLLKAALGGETGAASLYLSVIGIQNLTDPKIKSQIFNALRVDADAGNLEAISLLASGSRSYGVSDYEAYVYQAVYREISKGNDTERGWPTNKFLLQLLEETDLASTGIDEASKVQAKQQIREVVAAFEKRRKLEPKN